MEHTVPMQIYTIGHGNHTWERFLALLNQRGIGLLLDVRSNPVSRWAHFANRRMLPRLLDEQGIRHEYMGDSLGGKPSDPALYADGKPDYLKIAGSAEFQEGIARLLELAEGASTAIMCAEEDQAMCHRHLLIEPALEERGVSLLHIRRDGER